MEPSNSEERDQIDWSSVRHEEEPAPEAAAGAEAFQSDNWWRASAPASDWAEPVSEPPVAETTQRNESGSADIYFCGRTSLFPLNLAVRAIGKENLTGLLRARWDKEPVEVLARDGEIEVSSVAWVKADFEEINSRMAQAGKIAPAAMFKPGEDVRDFRAG